MHPAPSIIVFTVASGLGYGLAFHLSLGLLEPALASTRIAWFIALALVSIGLLSSTLHLGNPQRAWRALTQWRSSWLSREGVMAVAAFVPLGINAALSIFAGSYSALLGVVGAAMCVLTVFCTAMIYGSLRTVQSWNTRLTPACFIMFALGGGGLLATVFASVGSGEARGPILAATIGLLLGVTAKAIWTNRMMTTEPLSTPESATGLGMIGRVTLLERPHAMGNYLTREMVYKVGRKHAAKVRLLAFALAAGVPLLCLLIMAFSTPGALLPLAVVATGSHLVGMLAERWLFFAEARHAVANYYGA